jgi:hypothetical protein
MVIDIGLKTELHRNSQGVIGKDSGEVRGDMLSLHIGLHPGIDPSRHWGSERFASAKRPDDGLDAIYDLRQFESAGSNSSTSLRELIRNLYRRCKEGYPQFNGSPMHMRTSNAMSLAPASRRWSRSRERSICPRRHLRVLPTRTRPSLFGGD